MGGYASYFTDNPMVGIGDEYMVELRGYDTWDEESILLV